jgi:DoxX-like protein
MERDKRIYWIATGLVCAVMVYSAINFNLRNPLGPMKGAFRHLLLPDYFRIELTIAKVLGVIALLIPRVPRLVKEFAYSGFAITLVSASIAHFSVGDSILFILDPLLFLGALITSYIYFDKLHRSGHGLDRYDSEKHPTKVSTTPPVRISA